ncbi:2'-5' RNA ligase family protein [Georgenia halophila]|uniref:2'-5' RNA ligase family protein n=1 Tax=Georgenia halophila TaxID=620889 RepID=A0ABP8KV08_9MICO
MHLPERRPGQVRIGVALQIPPPYSSVLQSVRSRVGDPMAHAVPPHVTLLGPTVVDKHGMPEVTDHLAAVAADAVPFVVRLSGAGTFRPVSPVVFVNVVRGAAECAALQVAVRQGLLAQELRFPYHPHVTVAHDLDDHVLDRAASLVSDFEATYAQGSMRLYEHGDDGVWRTVARFVLAAHGADAGTAPSAVPS